MTDTKTMTIYWLVMYRRAEVVIGLIDYGEPYRDYHESVTTIYWQTPDDHIWAQHIGRGYILSGDALHGYSVTADDIDGGDIGEPEDTGYYTNWRHIVRGEEYLREISVPASATPEEIGRLIRDHPDSDWRPATPDVNVDLSACEPDVDVIDD